MSAIADIDVQGLIEKQRFGPFQWTVLILCFSAALLDGYDAQIVGFVISGMARTWHVGRAAFGSVFSAGFAGLLIGALAMGTAADRWGRKTILIISTVLFGLFSFLTIFANSIDTLVLLRFLTGFGVGGALPNAIALSGEYGPRSHRITMMTTVGAGVSVGATLAGLIASQVLPHFGWRAVFYIGGLAPLALVLVLVGFLPESLRFLIIRKRSRRAAEKIVRRMAPDLVLDASTVFSISEMHRTGLPVKHLFTEGRGPLTVVMWLAFLCNNAALYTLIPWLPTLVHGMGLSIANAAAIVSVFSIGGICGAVGVGRFIDSANPYRVLVLVLFVAAVSTVSIGLVGVKFLPLTATIFVAGFCVAGGQHGANAHAGGFYPTFMRSTGLGWAMGVGKGGSIFGPLLLGELLRRRWPLYDILGVFSLVIASSAALFGLMGWLSARGAHAFASGERGAASSSGRTVAESTI
ncbi:MFS transporter [Caulobacter sp. S45]|uniref:MFS transporter n=1 Tax=Caulobacter sp. S45 TaxID=1641861 RepID=UPI00131AA6EA|nr:MFS transporter [Caulobacter sp. S45]